MLALHSRGGAARLYEGGLEQGALGEARGGQNRGDEFRPRFKRAYDYVKRRAPAPSLEHRCRQHATHERSSVSILLRLAGGPCLKVNAIMATRPLTASRRPCVVGRSPSARRSLRVRQRERLRSMVTLLRAHDRTRRRWRHRPSVRSATIRGEDLRGDGVAVDSGPMAGDETDHGGAAVDELGALLETGDLIGGEGEVQSRGWSWCWRRRLELVRSASTMAALLTQGGARWPNLSLTADVIALDGDGVHLAVDVAGGLAVEVAHD